MNSGFVLDEQRQNVTKFDPRGDKSCGVADFDAPSPAASPPREPQPAVGEPRSAPEVDAASAGGAVPKTSGCDACDLGTCTRHIRLPSESRLTSTRPHRRPPPKAAARSLRTRLTELRQARQPACRHPPQRPPGSLWTLPGRLTCGDKPARLPPRPGTRPQSGRTTSGTRRENSGSTAEWNN